MSSILSENCKHFLRYNKATVKKPTLYTSDRNAAGLQTSVILCRALRCEEILLIVCVGQTGTCVGHNLCNDHLRFIGEFNSFQLEL